MDKLALKLRINLMGLLLLLSFFVQSLIPIGYMPDLGSGKVFQVTICHGNDIKTIFVNADMSPVDKSSTNQTDQDNKKHTKPCVFSSVHHSSLASSDFIASFTEHLTYAQFVERDSLPSFFIIPTKSYKDRAPPASQA